MDSLDRDDLNRVRRDYVGDVTTQEDVDRELAEADFDGSSKDAFAAAIAGDEDLPESREVLTQVQRQAVGQLRDGGAIGGQVLQGKDVNTGRNINVGAPSNVTQEIERTGPESGRVIAENTNTGTRAEIGQIELPKRPNID